MEDEWERRDSPSYVSAPATDLWIITERSAFSFVRLAVNAGTGFFFLSVDYLLKILSALLNLGDDC